MTDFALSAIEDSTYVAKRVPMMTPSAPNDKAANAPLASTIPPAARIGICGKVLTSSGTREMILADWAVP